MKIAESTRKVKVSGAEDVSDFTGTLTPALMDIMSNKIYSDKPLAVIREYACNAADANTENGKADIPIHVSLPNRMEPVLKIRDGGKGLSNKEVLGTYIEYGNSTKRDSNAMIGFLGLGSKSGFAYGDSFVITSWHEGVKSVYSAFKGADKRFKMAALGKPEKDDSPSGMEIQIPIRNEDIGVIIEKARKFFEHWDVRPTFSGQQVVFSEAEVLIKKGNWKVLKTDRHSYNSECLAVMGKIAYPINSNMMSMDAFSQEDWTTISTMLNGRTDIIIQFNIGDIEVNAGRESLEYTDATQKSLGDALIKMTKELAALVQKEMKDCKTMFECKKFYSEAFRIGGKYEKYSRLLSKKSLCFNGQPVGGADWQLPYGSNEKNGFELISYQKNMYSSYQRNSKQIRSGAPSDRIVVQKGAVYVINETSESQGLLTRIVPLIECDGNYCKEKQQIVYLFNIKDRVKFDKWVKESDFDAPTLKLGDLPKVKMNEIYPPNPSNAKTYSKHKSKVFLLKADYQSGYGDAKSDAFEEVTVDLDTSTDLYVVIDRFIVKGIPQSYRGDASPREVLNLVRSACKFLGLKDVPRIIAVREKHKKTLGKNMTHLLDWMRSQVSALAVKEKLSEKLMGFQVGEAMEHEDYAITRLFRAVSALTTGPLQELSDMIACGVDEDRKHIQAFSAWCDKLKIKQSAEHHNCEKMAKALLSEVKTRYPMLFLTNKEAFFQFDSAKKASVVQYLKMVDEFHRGSENEGEHAYVLSGMLPLTSLI
jgi:hypothetical protein